MDLKKLGFQAQLYLWQFSSGHVWVLCGPRYLLYGGVPEVPFLLRHPSLAVSLMCVCSLPVPLHLSVG